MTDLYIFAFGLTVTLVVGSGLVAMIFENNRALRDGVNIDNSESR
jgi:hypothetical protein